MDWTYKHFDQRAVFKASRESVLEAARAAVSESLEVIEDTADGFVARGYMAWHPASATFRVTSSPDGSNVAVELLVKRATMRGYMLVDVGGYYNVQIDKWFTSIAHRLAGAPEENLVSKTTPDLRFRRGFLAGCLVYFVVAACLGIFAVPLNRALFPASTASIHGPFDIVASVIALIAGVVAFLYAMNRDASVSKSIGERLQGGQHKKK